MNPTIYTKSYIRDYHTAGHELWFPIIFPQFGQKCSASQQQSQSQLQQPKFKPPELHIPLQINIGIAQRAEINK